MIFPVAILATAISLALLLLTPVNGILTIVLLRPVIDASWANSFMGVNCLKIVGFFIPLLILPRIIGARDRTFFDMPLSKIGLVYIVSYMLGVTGLVSVGNISGATELFFRVLNGFLGFYMFQFYFTDRNKFMKLLFILLLAGLFPMAVGIYQAVTGKVWHLRQTAGLVRNVGLYYNAVGVRNIGFQTLTAILLAYSYFSKNNLLIKVMLVIYGLICCFVIFRAYSKAAIIIFCVWVILWSVFNRKFLLLLLIPISILLINYYSGNDIFQKVETVFSKEIGAYQGTVEDKYLLGGRVVKWKRYWNEWKQQDIFHKVFGAGSNINVHLDYLRILYTNGIIGLLIYIFLLFIIGWKLLINMLSNLTPLNVMGCMMIATWMVDTFAGSPSYYPSYQWYIWGFVGLALSGIEGLKEKIDTTGKENVPTGLPNTIDTVS